MQSSLGPAELSGLALDQIWPLRHSQSLIWRKNGSRRARRSLIRRAKAQLSAGDSTKGLTAGMYSSLPKPSMKALCWCLDPAAAPAQPLALTIPTGIALRKPLPAIRNFTQGVGISQNTFNVCASPATSPHRPRSMHLAPALARWPAPGSAKPEPARQQARRS